MAAGRGERLQPLTLSLPKALVPVGWRDGKLALLIEILLNQVKRCGICEVIIVVGYLKEEIMNFVGDGRRFDVNVSYIFQETLGGEAAALYQTKFLLDDLVLALDCDNFISDYNYLKRLVEYHDRKKPLVTIGVAKVKDARKYAIAKLDENNRLLDIVEKPKQKNKWQNLAKMGCYVCQKEIFSWNIDVCLSRNGEYTTTQLFKHLIRNGYRIESFPYKGVYADVGSWESLRTIMTNYKIDPYLTENMKIEFRVHIQRMVKYLKRKKVLEKTYNFNGINFHCITDDQNNIDALEEYLGPYENTDFDLSRYFKISAFADNTLYSSLLEYKVSLPLRKIEIYSNEFYWEYSDNDLDVYFPETDTSGAIIISINKKIFILVTRVEDPLRKIYCMRIIRPIIRSTSEHDGGILFHAGAVCNNNYGILIPGASSSGKTTLVLAMCYLLKGEYISNDRTILHSNNGGLLVQAWPAPVKLGLGTLLNFDGIVDLLSRYNLFRDQILNKRYFNGNSVKDLIKYHSDLKLEITPLELKKIVSLRVISSASLKFILFPHLTTNSNSVNLYETDSKDTKKKLMENVCSPYDPFFVEDWLKVGDIEREMVETNANDICDNIVHNVRGFVVEIGMNFIKDFDIDGRTKLKRILER